MKELMIAGCPRSGTTILTQALSKHNKMYITCELGIYTNKNTSIKNRIIDGTLGDNSKYAWFPQKAGVTFDRMKEFAASEPTGEQTKKYIEATVRKYNVEIIGDKLPIEYTNIMYEALLSDDNLFVIYCLRDGRAVIDSQLRHRNSKVWWRANSVRTAEKLWLNDTSSYLQQVPKITQNKKISNRFMVLRYESDKNEVARQLSKLLGITIEPSLFDIYDKSHLDKWKKSPYNIDANISDKFKDRLHLLGYGEIQ